MSRPRPYLVHSSSAEGSNAGLPPSGGDGTPPDMERRIDALEAGMRRLDEKIDRLTSIVQDFAIKTSDRFGAIEGRLAVIETKLDAKADRTDLAAIETRLGAVKDAIDTRAPTSELNLIRGKVDSLPTTIQLIMFAVAVFVAAGLTRLFAH